MLNIDQLRYDYEKPFIDFFEGCEKVTNKNEIKYINNKGKVKLKINYDSKVGELNGNIFFVYIDENDLVKMMDGHEEDVRKCLAYAIRKQSNYKKMCVISINHYHSAGNCDIINYNN